jgi:predicted dehydrogenase
MTRPVAIALIGMGWWGKKMLNVLSGAPADIRVVRAVEPNLETVRTLCAEKGVALSADYGEALADPAVEAVVLATPHALHGAQIEAAVAAGKHVFCEKPLALTKAGAEKAVRLCRDAGLVLGMGHERRWEPPSPTCWPRLTPERSGAFTRSRRTSVTTSSWRLIAIIGA